MVMAKERTDIDLVEEGLLEHTCTACGHRGSDVLSYYGKIGGSDEPVRITACADIDACLERQEDRTGQSPVGEVIEG